MHLQVHTWGQWVQTLIQWAAYIVAYVIISRVACAWWIGYSCSWPMMLLLTINIDAGALCCIWRLWQETKLQTTEKIESWKNWSGYIQKKQKEQHTKRYQERLSFQLRLCFPNSTLWRASLFLSSSATTLMSKVLTKVALGSVRLNVCTPASVLGMSMYITWISDKFHKHKKKASVTIIHGLLQKSDIDNTKTKEKGKKWNFNNIKSVVKNGHTASIGRHPPIQNPPSLSSLFFWYFLTSLNAKARTCSSQPNSLSWSMSTRLGRYSRGIILSVPGANTIPSDSNTQDL